MSNPEGPPNTAQHQPSYPGPGPHGPPGGGPQSFPGSGPPPGHYPPNPGYPYHPPPGAHPGPPRGPPARPYAHSPYYPPPGQPPQGPRPGAPGGPPSGPPPPGARTSWAPPGAHAAGGYPPHHMGTPHWPQAGPPSGPPPPYAYAPGILGQPGGPPGSWPKPSSGPPQAPSQASSAAGSTAGDATYSSANDIDFDPDAYENDESAAPSAVSEPAAVKKEETEWTVHNAGEGKGVYYYNVKTGESTWDKPPGLKDEVVKAAMSTEAPKPVSWDKIEGCDWQEVKTSDGKVYYYNSSTQVLALETRSTPASVPCTILSFPYRS